MKQFEGEIFGYTGLNSFSVTADGVKIEDSIYKFFIVAIDQNSVVKYVAYYPVDKTLIFKITEIVPQNTGKIQHNISELK